MPFAAEYANDNSLMQLAKIGLLFEQLCGRCLIDADPVELDVVRTSSVIGWVGFYNVDPSSPMSMSALLDQ